MVSDLRNDNCFKQDAYVSIKMQMYILFSDFIHKPKEDSATSIKRPDKKSMFGSVFSKRRNENSKSLKHDQYPLPSWEFHAADSKLSDKEIIEMFSSLKNKEFSQEELLEMARK